MGQGKLAESAREHLHTMRRNGLASVLGAAASHLTQEQGAWLHHEILEMVEETLRAALAVSYPHRTYLLNAGRIAGKSNWQPVEELDARL